MAIKSEFEGGGNFIKEPGEYVVEIRQTIEKMSSTNKPMLVVEMETFDHKKIAGYFVRGLDFHARALEKLKLGCGLAAKDPASMLIGKSCGILVKAQEPDANGRVFMSITGYGKPEDVEGYTGKKAASGEDNLPW